MRVNMNIQLVLVTVCLLAVTATEGARLKTPKWTEVCRNDPKSLSCKLAYDAPNRANRVLDEDPEDKKAVWLPQDPSWVVYSTGKPGFGVHDAAKALDGDTWTYWNPWTGKGRYFNNWYIILDLAVPHILTRIAVNNQGDRARSIAAFTLQRSEIRRPYSWEDVTTVDDVQVGTNRRQEFGGFRGTARYWRLLITKTHSGWQPFLAELNLYGVPAGKTLTEFCRDNPKSPHCKLAKDDPDREGKPIKQTEFCRNNPKSLSCKLAETDPDRALRLYEENQWAFMSEEPRPEDKLRKKRSSTHAAPACRTRREWRNLTPHDLRMEPFSLQLQAYDVRYQGYPHADCLDTKPVISCAGVCQMKKTKIKVLIIYKDNGITKVDVKWVSMPTACQLEVPYWQLS